MFGPNLVDPKLKVSCAHPAILRSLRWESARNTQCPTVGGGQLKAENHAFSRRIIVLLDEKNLQKSISNHVKHKYAHLINTPINVKYCVF